MVAQPYDSLKNTESVNDTWTKPKVGRKKDGKFGWLGYQGEAGEDGDNYT